MVLTKNEFDEQIHAGKKWIIINNMIYDIENFRKIHPGGAKIISSFIGKDATDSWTVMHPDKDLVRRYMKPLIIEELESPKIITDGDDLMNDYRNLRKVAIKRGCFKTSPSFYFAYYAHILCLEALAWLIFNYLGVDLWSFIFASVILATSQAQAGWLQHDFGHASVFNTNRLNKILHHIVIGHLKGASCTWWNFRHNLHHSQPNTMKYDPDIGFPYLFLIGSKLPLIWGSKHKGYMPYNIQHTYFLPIFPPLLLPIYFHYENLYFIIKRQKWKDFIFQFSYYIKFYVLFAGYFDTWYKIFGLYMTMRLIESFWFVLITQMSHIPMESDIDINQTWFRHQLSTTCNVESNLFNDWLTGHLNFQIEHHLFPDMPRHNYHLIKPDIMQLCQKYKIEYVEKSILVAIGDILRSLRSSGQLWLDAYLNPG